MRARERFYLDLEVHKPAKPFYERSRTFAELNPWRAEIKPERRTLKLIERSTGREHSNLTVPAGESDRGLVDELRYSLARDEVEEFLVRWNAACADS